MCKAFSAETKCFAQACNLYKFELAQGDTGSFHSLLILDADR